MLTTGVLLDPDVLFLCLVALFYAALKALALYDRLRESVDDRPGSVADGPRPR